jgi:hypothetical protein
MSKVSTITKPGQSCRRCAEPLPPGTRAIWSNLPNYRGWLHVDACAKNPAAVNAPADESTEAPKAPAAPLGSLDAIMDARIDARLEGFEPSAALDADEVRALATEAARAVVGQTLTVTIQRPDAPPVTRKDAHVLYPRVAAHVGAGHSVYLWGPPGSGKTTLAMQVAADLGLAWELDTLDPSTARSAVQGYRTPVGEPVQTAFTRCYPADAAYIADELDASPAQVQSLFNSALANGHAVAAWGPLTKGARSVFIGTGNSPGAPTPQHPDRKRMGEAFKDRLFFIYVPLDPAIECRAGGLPVPPAPVRTLSTCSPAAWVGWVQSVRAWAAQNAPTLMVTPRASLAGLKALAIGETPREVADGLVFRGADEALTRKALAACPLPTA